MPTLCSKIPLLLVLLLSAGFAEDAYAPPDDGDPETDNTRPMLGINMSPVPVSVQQTNDLTPDDGVYVRRVYPNTAASRMGIEQGDVVLSVNGESVDSMSTLRELVFSHRVNEEVAVTVVRDGQRIDVADRFGGWPEHIPMGRVDAASERRYRRMQARRLEREESQYDRRLNRAREELAALQDEQAQAGAVGEGAKRPGGRRNDGRAASALDLALDDAFGRPLPGVLPVVSIPRMAALLRWRLAFRLHCDDPGTEADESAPFVASGPSEDGRHDAPGTINYGFRVSTERAY